MSNLKRCFSTFNLHTKEIVYGVSISFLFRIIGAAAQFIFSVLIARLFGTEGFGLYALALSIIVISSTVARWGLDQSALKYISISADKGEWGSVKDIFLKALLMVVGLGFIVTILVYIIAPLLAGILFNELKLGVMMRIMAFGIIPFSIINLIAESLRALNKMGLYTIIQGVLVPLLSAVSLVVCYYISSDINSVAYAYVISCYFTLFVAVIILAKSFHMLSDNDKNGFIGSKVLLKTASPMAWVALIGIWMGFSETVLLGIFKGPSEVGLYAAALRLALLINFVIIAFNSILAPKIAVLHKQGSMCDIKLLVHTSIRFMLFFTLPIFIWFIFFPENILSIFSPEFKNASSVLMILAFGQLFNIIAGPVGVILLMTGHERLIKENVMVASVVSLSVSIVFIPAFGITGAACGATVGMIVLNCLSSWSVRKELGIKTIIVNPLSFEK